MTTCLLPAYYHFGNFATVVGKGIPHTNLTWGPVDEGKAVLLVVMTSQTLDSTTVTGNGSPLLLIW